MEPRTLLEMAGIPRTLPVLGQSVLVIIDAQEEYRSGSLPLDGIEGAITALQSLLAAARQSGATVFHIVHKGRAGGLFDLSGHGGRIFAELAPLPEEPVIEKPHPNAFHQTPLLEKLRAGKPQQIILAGFQTHMCLSSTARTALDLGFLPVIAADATATRALPSAGGGKAISADMLQNASLAALADRFAIIAQTHELVQKPV